MRKLIFISILFFASFIILAQTKSRFPITPTSVWRVDSIDAIWQIFEQIKFFIQGDTLINDLYYFKLYKTGVAYYDRPFYYENVYIGAIRDEENKIFYIKKNRTSEVFLYDFNLKIGETIKSAIGKGKTILFIDTLLDGRKVLYYDLGYFTTSYIIEGIGTNGGLFSGGSSYRFIHSGEKATYLICYVENGTLVYQNELGFNSNCEIVNPDHQYSINTSAKWRMDTEIDNDTMVHYERYQYYILGDTIINNTYYYKFFKKSHKLIRTDPGEYLCVMNENKYMGAIRDHENKYYFVQNGSSNEELLYDFNLKKGEKNTAKIYKDETVYEVDTILDNRKIIYFGNDLWQKRVIAGIGSVNDFLDEKKTGTYLRCYSENDVPIYHPSGIYDCELKLSDAAFPTCNKLVVMPNYFSGSPEKKLKITLCYQIPFENGLVPVFAGYNIIKKESTFRLDLYYEDANPIIPGQQMITNIITDTVPIGILEQGYYKIECSVNTVHTEGSYDTTFNDIRFDFYFYISHNPNVGITEFVNSKIRIFPVPSKDRIFIESIHPDSKITSVEIYNITGIRVFSKNVNNIKSIDLDLTHLKKGIYIIKINEHNTFTTQKIIIK